MSSQFLPLTAKATVALLFVAQLTGCRGLLPITVAKTRQTIISATSTSAIARPTDLLRKEHYQKWPRDIRNAVDKHFLLLAMDKIQAQVAMDILESSITRQTPSTTNSTTEIWTVWRGPGYWSATQGGDSQVSLTFTAGRLTSLRRVASEPVAVPATGQDLSTAPAPNRANSTPPVPHSPLHPSLLPPDHLNQRLPFLR